MIPIAEIFQKKFQGISYFYVDDSVIFTNDVKEDDFGEQLEDINAEIEKLEEELLKDAEMNLQPQVALKMREAGLYGIHVHGMEEKKAVSKSGFTRLDQLDESELYLKCISREASEAGNEMFKIYSDEEDMILEERMKMLSDEIQKKIAELDDRIGKLKQGLIRLQNASEREKDADAEREYIRQIQSLSKFRDRWVRYYRFFEYRKQRLSMRHMFESDKDRDKDNKRELYEIIYRANACETDEDKLEIFMKTS